jgi:hypothetical protein
VVQGEGVDGQVECSIVKGPEVAGVQFENLTSTVADPEPGPEIAEETIVPIARQELGGNALARQPAGDDVGQPSTARGDFEEPKGKFAVRRRLPGADQPKDEGDDCPVANGAAQEDVDTLGDASLGVLNRECPVLRTEPLKGSLVAIQDLTHPVVPEREGSFLKLRRLVLMPPARCCGPDFGQAPVSGEATGDDSWYGCLERLLAHPVECLREEGRERFRAAP